MHVLTIVMGFETFSVREMGRPLWEIGRAGRRLRQTCVELSIQEINTSSRPIADKLVLSWQASPPLNQPCWRDGRNAFHVLSEAQSHLPESKPRSDASYIRKVYDAGDASAVWHASKSFIKSTTETWPGLDEAEKQANVHRIAAICRDLTEWKGNTISGVNATVGSWMDCSSFVFYHYDLDPGNICHSLRTKRLFTAGFVSVEWGHTEFCISGGMDLPVEDKDARLDWRRLVSRRPSARGFVEAADEWMEWWNTTD
ncbi:kinase-like protein [Nemania abortiva]|nr:kinase-like protein [Nemania abortiva]